MISKQSQAYNNCYINWVIDNNKSTGYSDYAEFTEWLESEYLIFNGPGSITFYKPEQETMFLLRFS